MAKTPTMEEFLNDPRWGNDPGEMTEEDARRATESAFARFQRQGLKPADLGPASREDYARWLREHGFAEQAA